MQISAAASGATSEPGRATEPSSAARVACDFEALLINQLLKAARTESAFAADEQSACDMREIGEQQLSLVLARSGGLGLARMLDSMLLSHTASEPASSAGPGQ